MLKLRFSTQDASFENFETSGSADVLREIAERLDTLTVNMAEEGGAIHDENGNTIGRWEFAREQKAGRGKR